MMLRASIQAVAAANLLSVKVDQTVGLVGVIGGMFLAVRARFRRRNHHNGKARIEKRLQLIGAVTGFPMGIVVGGLSGVTGVAAICAADSVDLVFMPSYDSRVNPGDPGQPAPELGRIPREVVRSLRVSEHSKSQLHAPMVHRRSLGRGAPTGSGWLVDSKRKSGYLAPAIPGFYLTVDWRDSNDVGQVTIFEFADGLSANKAENALRQSLLPRRR